MSTAPVLRVDVLLGLDANPQPTIAIARTITQPSLLMPAAGILPLGSPLGQSPPGPPQTRGMSSEDYLNTYHNASTPPPADVPPDLAGFMLAADAVLANAAELARVVSHAHQGAAAQLIGDGWAHARKYFSLSEKYRDWADYHTPAVGFGIHAYAHKVSAPIRLTDEELRAHPEWRGFGREAANHPPMRGWLMAPLIGADGLNYGFIQASDRVSGDFTEQDEACLVRLAALTSSALDALAQLHMPDYHARVANLKG